MLAITLDQAKTLAIVIVVGLLVLAVAWAWLMKTIVQKLIGVAIIVALAAVVWFQRGSLQDCADKVKASAAVTGVDTTCTFFGQDIHISASR